MELDGDHRDAEVEGDLLVEASARDLAEDLTLTCGEGRQPFDVRLDEQDFLSAGNVLLDGGVHSVEQRLVSHRLREEVYGAQLHGLYRHGNVAMPGNENDGRRVTPGCEAGLEIEPARSRHAHVEN